jgi:hypothetical protein
LLKRRWNRRTAARWPRLELDVDDVAGYRGWIKTKIKLSCSFSWT